VPTGYGYVLEDQNGWSRYLHFEAAWLLVLTGVLYVLVGTSAGHFKRQLLPVKQPDADSYNTYQRLTYLVVVFALFPIMIWTGLAMSPAFVSAVPWTVTLLGGRQTARTLHFFVSVSLVLFLLVHVTMVWRAGFRTRVGAMITGHTPGSGL
jgi:thiosulfate reductase cytochrome b subunit